MGFVKRHPLLAACAALAAVLVAVLGFETGWGTRLRPELPPPSGKPAAAADARVLPPITVASVDQAYPETAARPLFIPTRRPVPAAPTAASTTMAKGSLQLQGVTIAGGVRIALLKDKATGKIHRVDQGRELNGMTLAQVEPDRVLLKQGDDSETLLLSVQRGPGSPAAAAAAAGPFGGSAAGTPGSPGSHAGFPMASSPGGVANSAATLPNGSAPMAPNAQGTPGQPPATLTLPATTGAPMTAEELLARRRARRNP